jgi:hypothetical protein
MAGGRKFTPLSPDEAEAKIHSSLYMGTVDGPWEIPDYFTSQITKDISKVNFDFENFECSQEALRYKGLAGFHTLSNGLTFLGCVAGGDWQYPVFFIVYYDGKKLRGYVPKNGNNWNYTTKTAFGEDEKADEEAAAKQWPKFDFRVVVDVNDLPGPDLDAIKADIMARIIPRTVVGKAPLKMWPDGTPAEKVTSKSKKKRHKKDKTKTLYFCIDGRKDEYFVFISYEKDFVDDQTSRQLETAVDKVFSSFAKGHEIDAFTAENAHMVYDFSTLVQLVQHLLKCGAEPMPSHPVELEDPVEARMIKALIS